MPRLIAFSIVSSGTEARPGLLEGGPEGGVGVQVPPAVPRRHLDGRMHLAKTLARALSWAPLRYLVVAHFE